MELRTYHKRMHVFWKFCYLHELAVLPLTRKHEACFLELFYVLGVYLVAVTVTFGHLLFPIRLADDAPFFEDARIRAKAHRAAVIFPRELLLLVRKNVYDRMRRFLVYFRRIRVLESRGVPRVFNDQHVEAVAEPEVRDFILARELRRLYLSLDTRLAESAGNDDTVVLGERFNGEFPAFDIFSVYPCYLRLHSLRV